MRDFQRKVRVRDLKLKSLIKFRLSQNRLQSRSRSRCADARLPSFSSGVLAHCRRCGALSEGGFLPDSVWGWVFCQRGHLWPKRWNSIIGWKSPAFVDLLQADTENFVRELQASQRETNIQAVRPPYSCCATMVTIEPWRYARPLSSPDPTCGNYERGWNAFIF